MESWWTSVDGDGLYQGDFFPGCLVPVLPDDFADSRKEGASICLEERDLIVITQSCDLANAKVSLVALCSAWTIADFEKAHVSHSISPKQWLSQMEQRAQRSGARSPFAAIAGRS